MCIEPVQKIENEPLLKLSFGQHRMQNFDLIMHDRDYIAVC